MGITALIDADSLIFSAGFAVEKAKYAVWERGAEEFGPLEVFEKKKDIPKEFLDSPDLIIEKRRDLEPLENCLQIVKQKIWGILQATACTDYKIFIKGTGNFRDKIAVTRKYKGNRDPSLRPTYEQEIRKYLKQVWHAEEVNGMEADDALAIAQSDDMLHAGMAVRKSDVTTQYGNTIICSIDKDLDQIFGWHFNYSTGKTYWVDELEAKRNFYTQLLSGDASDNIPGVDGIGKIGAKKLLKGCTTDKEMWEVVYEQYHRVYGAKASDMLSEQGSLLYLLRHPNDKWELPSVDGKDKAA